MITLKINDRYLRFEHSLASLSEWEAEYEKPFFARHENENKTEEEMLRYFECMLVSSFEDRHLIMLMSPEQRLSLANYINAGRSATIVREIPDRGGPKEHTTSELIYFWMISFRIPFKPCDEWHLNRLLMLVRICSVKNAKPDKRKSTSIAQDYRKANEARRRQLGTSG